MARVTVEDCVDKVANRFELVILAGQRARAMSAGSDILVERDNDKNPVVALREIADEKITAETLREDVIGGLQRHLEVDEPEEEENLAMLMEEDSVSDDGMSEEDLLRAMNELGA